MAAHDRKGEMKRRPCILLLSGASLVGQNVLACLGGHRHDLELVAANSAPDDPCLFDFDAVYLTPENRRQPDAYSARFRELLAEVDPDLVIPCRDDDVTFLAGERDRQPEMACRFLCGDAMLAAAMLDKLESARLSARLGLPFAPTLDAGVDPATALRFAVEHGFPLIGKPRRGFASHGVRLILDRQQLENACGRPDYVLQKYLGNAEAVRRLADAIARNGLPLFHTLEEPKLSIQALVAPDGAVRQVFASHNLMRLGRSERVEVVGDAAVLTAGTSWATAFACAGWRGPLNIQCQLGPGSEATIYEYNGRFTGATAARQLLGFDEVGLALRDWLGLPLLPPLPSADMVVRQSVSRPVDTSRVAQLRRDGCWRSDASA